MGMGVGGSFSCACPSSQSVLPEIAGLFSFSLSPAQPLRVRQDRGKNQPVSERGNGAASRSRCRLCSISRRCFFARFSPSSEAAISKRSSSWPCGSNSQPTPRRGRSPSSRRSIAPSGWRCSDSGLDAKRSWSLSSRPRWSVGITRDSDSIGDGSRSAVLGDRGSRRKCEPSFVVSPWRMLGEHGRFTPNSRSSDCP